MLTENEVLNALRAYLERNGYPVDEFRTTLEKGVDLVATHKTTGRTLAIEAKGATSSNAKTSRFGKGFKDSQIRTHVARAFFSAAELKGCADWHDVAIALPDTEKHRRLTARIGNALEILKISLFWVDSKNTVSHSPYHK